MPAPHYALTLDHVTETALKNPLNNAPHLPAAQAAARRETLLLEQCLAWLEPGSREHREITADLAWVRSLPGYDEQTDFLEYMHA